MGNRDGGTCWVGNTYLLAGGADEQVGFARRCGFFFPGRRCSNTTGTYLVVPSPRKIRTQTFRNHLLRDVLGGDVPRRGVQG